MGIPDLRFINRKIPIIDVARELGLLPGANGNIHCWRPEFHQNGDRTASVGVRKQNNTVKCFGCGIGPLGVVDLVMAVTGTRNPGEAARWIAERFPVPEIQPGKHLKPPERPVFKYGSETDIGLLVFSGIWARLSPTARAIAPVLLELAERDNEQNLKLQISYRALAVTAAFPPRTRSRRLFANLKKSIGFRSSPDGARRETELPDFLRGQTRA